MGAEEIREKNLHTIKIFKARLEKVFKDKPKPSDNLSECNKFIKSMNLNDVSINTIKNAFVTITVFSDWCDKPFSDLDENDIEKFIDYLDEYTYEKKGKKVHYKPASIYTHKTNLRKFLHWLKRDDLVKCIKCKTKKYKQLPEDILNQNDVDALIQHAITPRDKAIVAVLFESGVRKGEMAGVCIKHLIFDANGVVLTIPDGKTGPRRIRLIFASSYLHTWLDCHPLKNDTDAPLFVSHRIPYPRISDAELYVQLQRIAKRAGIKKRVNPHSFRHASATRLAKHLTEAQLKTYLGWKEDSSMAAVYVHLSGIDVDPAILKMNGIEVEEEKDVLKVGRCPRCKELNPETSLFCGKCGMPLKDDSVRQLETEQDDFETEFSRLLAKYPNIIEHLHANKTDG